MKKAIKEKRPFILAHWHGDEGVLVNVIRRYRIATLVSNSDDGQIMNSLVHILGGATARGSSSKNAVSGLKSLIRLVRKQKRNTSISVDGPRGPAFEVKPGVFEISKMIGLPIYYGGVGYDKAFQFPKSWNKAYIPKPFSKVTLIWEGPLDAVPRDGDAKSPELSSDLKKRLDGLRQLAFKEFAKDGAES